ncbi:MAG: AmmeMemoRadiSam system radical SAM enzyme [Schwartzia sp.]|nr:AmmeMemoRadiSam system radical SAM enzyme [Schwartzia sp. (in: firmicutes)]
MANKAICPVCFHHCALSEGQTGLCQARGNRGGEVVSLSYGLVTSIALDPVEKKPFSRWQSGKYILSVGTFGCNLSCAFCQNASISQVGEEAETDSLSPERLADLAKEFVSRDNVGAAFTYNEPLIGWEYVYDSAKLLHEKGLLVALVTNGTAEPEILEKLLPYVDAMNIDLKTWSAKSYKKLGGDLDTVKRTITWAAKSCHVEVTTLAVPGISDSVEDMDREAVWLASISEELPLHISRYFPRWKMNEPMTPMATMEKLCETARRHLKYVYAGNCY